MSDLVITDSCLDQSLPVRDRLASLKESGADRFDPVSYQFISSLLDRSDNAKSTVSAVLQQKAVNALALYLERLQKEQTSSRPVEDKKSSCSPFKGLFTGSGAIESLPLPEIEASPQDDYWKQLSGAVKPTVQIGAGKVELKAMQALRESQAKEASKALIENVLQQAPENPGPLNPEMLLARSISIMKDLSPAYLHRFMAYAETLFWLEQTNQTTD